MALDDSDAASHRRKPPPPQPDGDAARLVGDERLPCGRLVSDIWEQARAGTGRAYSHMTRCSYCRQATEGLTVLDSATRALRAERPSAHTVADRVVRAVRAETRLSRMLPLDDPVRELRIAETAAAKVLRHAADGVPGVRAASCRLTPEPGGATVTVARTLATTLDQPVPVRAAEVRRAVTYAARRRLGLALSSIDVTIVSVLEHAKLRVSAGPPPRNASRP
jgi:hypothetical protein